MFFGDYSVLIEIAEEFRQNLADLDARIECNLRGVKEADIILKKYTESESDDVKVFSPRRMEVLHKEEIQKARKDKAVFEEKNVDLLQEREFLSKRLGRLEKVLERQNSGKDLSDASLYKLKEMLRRVEIGSKYIDQNHTSQAKQEFAYVTRALREMLDGVQQ